ncbi:PREDICTED: NEP1-interacting protein-like 1 [Nicotiana attenuata]|uniref:Nep1-interacting protein 1 n=1 Tax=Nicotiana attenuata TaxID=49451 RepID=A0A1J6IVS6_NICAT|nr:PREDICTED: NEP1-interacting protein-like 1 [Nicotiana attenuata]OIT01823.1 nep1-interacting protein 1 [Nicotiana attenuata]
MTTNWFSCIHSLLVKSKEFVFTWVFLRFAGFSSGLLLMVIKNAIWALFMCILALGGATVGIITGAIKGQTTETGLLRGAAVGAVTGAITTVQLVELIVNGEPFSKVALVCSLVNGKVFMEWVSPAVLKAYQWQVSTVETSLREISDIFDINATRGLSQEVIQKLPKYNFCSVNTCREFQEVTCAICLQDFKDGDSARLLPSCKHSFHTQCIDEWLIRHGSCPICRVEI